MDIKVEPGFEKIESLRKIIAEQLKVDKTAYKQMENLLDANTEIMNAISSHYGMLSRGERIRPTFGNEMQILYMRDRQTYMFLLFPELKQLCYEIGKLIGEKVIAPGLVGSDLPSLMYNSAHYAADHKYAYQEIVEATQNFGIYRNYECADCYGFPNIGQKICVYEAGTAAGQYQGALGRPVEVIETKCCANGDKYCEFEIHLL